MRYGLANFDRLETPVRRTAVGVALPAELGIPRVVPALVFQRVVEHAGGDGLPDISITSGAVSEAGQPHDHAPGKGLVRRTWHEQVLVDVDVCACAGAATRGLAQQHDAGRVGQAVVAPFLAPATAPTGRAFENLFPAGHGRILEPLRLTRRDAGWSLATSIPKIIEEAA